MVRQNEPSPQPVSHGGWTPVTLDLRVMAPNPCINSSLDARSR